MQNDIRFQISAEYQKVNHQIVNISKYKALIMLTK